jgi:hypothetical protein
MRPKKPCRLVIAIQVATVAKPAPIAEQAVWMVSKACAAEREMGLQDGGSGHSYVLANDDDPPYFRPPNYAFHMIFVDAPFSYARRA